MPTQTSDGTPIPAASSDTQYIQDPTAGFVYIVTSSVTVVQRSIEDIQIQIQTAQAQVTQANEEATSAQALVDELSPQVTQFQTALASVRTAPIHTVAPAQDI